MKAYLFGFIWIFIVRNALQTEILLHQCSKITTPSSLEEIKVRMSFAVLLDEPQQWSRYTRSIFIVIDSHCKIWRNKFSKLISQLNKSTKYSTGNF